MEAHKRRASKAMRVVWHQRPSLDRKLSLAEAFGDGILAYGDENVSYRIEYNFDYTPDCDVAVLFGIGGVTKRVWEAYRFRGRQVILLDKAYSRRTGHWRVSVGSSQPLSYLMKLPRPEDRLRKIEELGVALEPFRARGECILLDGASNKYLEWYGLGTMREWGESMVNTIRKFTDRRIIYRPRPTHNQPIRISGAELSVGPLSDDFNRSFLVVSNGGNIGWDAVIAGLPHFAISDSVARPVSETEWRNINNPRSITEQERRQWAANVAYCQFTEEEFGKGLAWHYIRQHLA